MTSLLSVKQVAFILKVHPLTIRRYLKEKRLKGIKVGGNIRIEENALQAFHQEISAPLPEKSMFRQFKKITAKPFTPEDPLLRLQGRAASLKLS